MLHATANKPNARIQRGLLLLALLGLAHWFFGNFYEAIVLAPNMVGSTMTKLQAWQGYFTRTNQLYYYVPFTQLAVVAVWVAWVRSRQPAQRRYLRRAAWWSLAALALTGYIVTQLNLQLFFGDLNAVQDQLDAMAWQWNLLNAVRVTLLGAALYHTYRAQLLSMETANVA